MQDKKKKKKKNTNASFSIQILAYVIYASEWQGRQTVKEKL
jgi:hypothetical protein